MYARQQNLHLRVFVVQILDDAFHRFARVELLFGLDHARALSHRIRVAIHDKDFHSAVRMLFVELRRRRMGRRVRAAAACIDGNIERLLHALTVVFLKFVEELKLRNLRRCRQAGRLFQHLAELFRGKIDSLGVSLAIQRQS